MFGREELGIEIRQGARSAVSSSSAIGRRRTRFRWELEGAPCRLACNIIGENNRWGCVDTCGTPHAEMIAASGTLTQTMLETGLNARTQ